MSLWIEAPLTVLASVALWIAGTIFFDAVHWVLHCMLRSRWAVLRALAWPHGVHHRFLDERLEIRWENRRKNVFCHLVPEYLTQLAFSAALLLFLPAAPVIGCAALQTLVFGFLLKDRGLDVNHRPIETLDAYRPSFLCPPAYHALHHVYPDAYYAAYNKLVDWAVGGGAQLRGRRFAVQGARTPLGRALRACLLLEAGGEIPSLDDADGAAALARGALGAVDVLVLCDPGRAEAGWVEAFIEATRDRQLPPEVWAVHEHPAEGLARHYYRDLRVVYRSLVSPGAAGLDPHAARRAARTALFLVRRGLHYVPTRIRPGALLDFRRFRRSAPVRPPGVLKVASRAELLAA